MGALSRWILKILGWRIINQLPDDNKYMLIVAPHTSNWDFVYGVLAKSAVGLKVNFWVRIPYLKVPLLGGLKRWAVFRLNATRNSTWWSKWSNNLSNEIT